MFKKIAISAPVLALAFVSSAAMAVPQTHTIEVYADIPSSDFYVQPSNLDTVQKPQQLAWDIDTSTLKGISRNFKVKSNVSIGTAPAIKATLMDPAFITSGEDDIQLTVKFNDVDLTDGSEKEVFAADAAKVEVIAPLSIEPIPPTVGDYKEGNYTGFVRVMFDAP
ncbi:CS1 type fimbrial major subunit [Pseudomonas azerbaijanorientalis]|jgi:hypothetical protein|uniref:CS1 type fimbrial major subunit n=1 Tax=Pseudomonas azerbaijanorientalis TaxID=2842350 RepID=UPI001C3E2A62|nr:CS1 type fimbrial major subunit [Pseudomonas azerbaijanorientalis]QXH63491.1 fimbrial protein [Pseudomonas azerbaijanorientalis]